MSATKHDQGKPRMDLLSDLALEEVSRVLGFGANKPGYGAHNWRKGMEWSRLIASVRRHIGEYAKGVDIDPETGFSHLAHAMCCLMFLEEYRQTGTGEDNRYKVEKKPHHWTAEEIRQIFSPEVADTEVVTEKFDVLMPFPKTKVERIGNKVERAGNVFLGDE